MDQSEAWIDSVLAGSAPTDVADAGSSPDAGEPTADLGHVEAQTVAPDALDAGTDSSAIPDPAADAEARFAALEARLAESDQKYAVAAEKADRLDQLAALAQERAAQQQREQMVQGWQERAANLQDLNPEMQKIESARLVAEVEQANAARYQPQVQQLQAEGEGTAAIAAGFYHAITSNPTLSDAQKQQLINDSKYLAQLPSPQAQQQTLARDRQIAETARAQAKAEFERQYATRTQTQVQQRIANGTDLVGATPGGTGQVDDGSIDFIIDRAFNNRR